MNIRTATFDQLTDGEIAVWSAIQRDNPTFSSPFFRPEFTQAVAIMRKNVEVAVLEEDGLAVGFFPFERMRRNHGLPVGTRLSDFHGVIAPGSVRFEPSELVRSCGLASWTFDHLVSANTCFEKFTYRHADSPYMDVSDGYEAYASNFHSSFRCGLRRRQRKLESEFGPLRLDFESRDTSLLYKLIDWKIAQYERTKTQNTLGFTWVCDLLEEMLGFRSQDFSTLMPVLYAGDRVLAISYQLRSRKILHGWFSAYDRELARFGPGMQHRVRVLMAAPSLGIAQFHLGKGPEEYKQIFQSDSVPLSEGVVDPMPLKAGVRSAWWAVRDGIRATPLQKLLKRPARMMYDLRGWMALK